MRRLPVLVVLSATVAFSSSNILPLLATVQQSEPLEIDGQQDDNIISNKLDISKIVHSLFKEVPYSTSENERSLKKTEQFASRNNNRENNYFDNIIDKNDNYDGEGFRKEQWHNYPRQLDRLHKYLFEHRYKEKENPNADDPDNTNSNSLDNRDNNSEDITTNKFLLDTNPDANNVYEAVIAATNPLLILKVHLACLDNKIMKKGLFYKPDTLHDENTNDLQMDEDDLFNEINPAAKFQRDETPVQDAEATEDNTKEKTVNKRLFSMWSRLQSLSHKGHDLPHRRHIHTFYGLPDSDGGGVLTAETRATFMRPPGSPLRWG